MTPWGTCAFTLVRYSGAGARQKYLDHQSVLFYNRMSAPLITFFWERDMTEQPQDSRFRTVAEVAAYYRVEARSVRRWILKGLADGSKLQSVKIAGDHRIHIDRHLRPFMRIAEGDHYNIPTLPRGRSKPKPWSQTAERHSQPATT